MIPEIIESVQELIEAGSAYQVEGSVYYEVDRFPEFGKLSKIPRAEMLGIANERGNNPADPNKRDPLDFVLWQAQQEDEPGWESPWGIGRPGWHIECSTMSNLYLGKTIDIHAGGYDLIFPHHECEIAQIGPLQPSEPFVRYWMHIAMVYHEGQKMSKSLGNLIMISDLLQEWESNVIRLYLANHHYRSEWSYDIDKLNSASERADLYAEAALAKGGKDGGLNLDQEISQFEQAMNQDLNSPQALVVLDRMAEMILEEVESGHADKNAQGAFTERAAIFGLKLESGGPSEEVVKGWDKHLERFPA